LTGILTTGTHRLHTGYTHASIIIIIIIIISNDNVVNRPTCPININILYNVQRHVIDRRTLLMIQADRQTDRQTDRRTDRMTGREVSVTAAAASLLSVTMETIMR